MGLLIRLIAGGGVPAFFFFSFILMLLWNWLVAGHLGWGPTLDYWQAAGLWFLVTILLAWTGIASRGAFRPRRTRRPSRVAEGIERRLKDAFAHRAQDEEWEDLGAHIEGKIRRAFARWVDADEGTDWSELGERIEQKIRRKLMDWID